jgi:DtxR family Mn-dependent transcriptional regulator
MVSDSVEEYLQAIYSFNEKGKRAKNSDLANLLMVAPASVTQMVQKLADEALVEYEPYQGVVLTGKGMAITQKVVRRHRLLERFLHDFLGLRNDKIHEEACKLEHALSDETAAALCKSLGKPETCPDDENPIPHCPLDVEDCIQCDSVRADGSAKLVTELSNLKPGEEGEVAFVRGGSSACQRLMDMGLTRGARVKVVNAAPFRGPISVDVRGSTLALGRGLSSHVFVEVCNDHLTELEDHPHGPYHGRGRN